MGEQQAVPNEGIKISVFPAVEEFRQILLWPLALVPGTDADSNKTIADMVAEQAKALEQRTGSPWKRIKDPLFHITDELGEPAGGADRQEPYAEFVYFHDFVQSFLYPDPKQHEDGKAALHILRREDVAFVDVSVPGRATPYQLKVERCHMYLVRMGVAILALEVTSEGCNQDLDLCDVIELEDKLRRVYTPYFYWGSETGKYYPGAVASSVQWLDKDQKPIGQPSEPHDVASALNFVKSHREPPVFDHWKTIVDLPLKGQTLNGQDHNSSGSSKTNVSSVTWRHVLDERMPLLAYIRLAPGLTLSNIGCGDWPRLCFADPPSRSEGPGTYPYDKTFLKNFEADNCYDRFYSSGTRHMFAGFSYVVVGAARSRSDDKRDIFRDTIRHHFRHMYFQMALIAHLEFTTYLSFSSRLSAATEKDGIRSATFRNRLMRIHEDFLEFAHLFRFTGISNQMQAQEMFDHWRKHLRLNALLADVREELEVATNYLFARDEREQTKTGNRLNVIAVSAVGAGLAFAFLGMNVMWDTDTVNCLLGNCGPETTPVQNTWLTGYWRLLIGASITCAILLVFTALTSRAALGLLDASDRDETPAEGISRVVKYVYKLLGVTLTLCVVALVTGWGFHLW